MTQPIRNLLGNSPELRYLVQQSAQLSSLQQQFAAATPPELRPHCRVSGERFGVLLVACSNTTVAAKLRQMAPQLTQTLQAKGQKINGIQAKVQVSWSSPRQAAPSRQLGTPARQALSQLHARLTDCPLKRALGKMLDDTTTR